TEGYGCNLCNISCCCSCFDNFGKISTTKCVSNLCNFDLVWKRKFYSECNNCFNFKQCQWSCFFCNLNFCVKCVRTPSKEHCGQLHQTEKISIIENENSFNSAIKSNKFIIDKS